MRVGINGLGRIGRLVVRAGLGGVHRDPQDPRADGRLDIVHVNEVKGGATTAAHLLEFDSIHGRWREQIAAEGENSAERWRPSDWVQRLSTPEGVDWADLGCELVLECTGKFLSQDNSGPISIVGCSGSSWRRRSRRAALNMVVGVNDGLYEPARHRLLTAASCTTNCLAPVVKVVHKAIGNRHGQITTIHDPTNTNVVVDAPHRDLRRARSCDALVAADNHRQRDRDCADLSRTEGQAQRPAVRAPVLNAS